MARGVATLGVLLLALCLVPPLAAQPSERAAREQLDAIGEEIQGLSRRLSTTREARDDAGRELREVETALAETHRRLDALQAERRGLTDEIDALESRRNGLEAERADQVEALNAQLDALYRLGLTPQLKLLLNQDDPARLDRLQHYLNRLAKARNERLDELARLDSALADNRRALEARGTRLDALAEELASRSADLAEQMQGRAQLVAELDSRYATEQARLEDLNQDRAHAERVLREVQEALARLQRPPPSTAIEQTQGELPWPVQGQVASRFRRGDGVHRNGMLIRAAEGTPVRAVHGGRVVFADWMRGFGNLLIVDHGDQVMTLHAHLQHFGVEVGQAVSRGDTLGAVGASGGHDTPALYFEVRRGGEPIDPQSWIASR
ncbi:murein hydrolase activator EnvC family protein [Halomonas sp. LBP4]|uniref:murein hydrolase activator EnvC family protein n=1 Tax=Halomonas sp. LBP4 TaxID=2044917 RepID=UPI000D77012A|nr:peptidoglycan DD-metalloendopeptidase family protein [Halomonas sp. LBP4]PXX96622.1 peptidase M23 [Halomonas sp. LBP4]